MNKEMNCSSGSRDWVTLLILCGAAGSLIVWGQLIRMALFIDLSSMNVF